tara:strand:+ start:125 stop:709 length:585 start_codon:yes stop_codon:yes gene_type:complete
MKLSAVIIIILLIINTSELKAQELVEKINGFVLSSENGENIEGVHIQNVNSKKGTISSKIGYFEIEGNPTDRIRFSCISFETHYFKISELRLKSNILLEKTSIELDEIILKPMSWQQFKLEFVQKEWADEKSAEISIEGVKQYKGRKTMYKPNLLNAVTNPINYTYHVLNKKARQKRKTKRYQKIIEKSYLIND